MPVDTGTVIGLVGAAVSEAVPKCLAGGLAGFDEAWRRLDALFGQRVVVFDGPRGEIEGLAQGIDAHGALRLAVDGRVRTVGWGDVSVRRSASARTSATG